MATNPKIPPDARDRMQPPAAPGRKSFWPPLLIAVAIAVLIGIIVWLTHTPAKPAQSNSAQQVSGLHVQLRNLRPGAPTRSGEVELTGNVVNNANHEISGVTVAATFRNITGQALETDKSDLGPPQGTGQATGFANNPIPAGASRDFVVRFQHVPEGWNGNVPQLLITQVRPGK